MPWTEPAPQGVGRVAPGASVKEARQEEDPSLLHPEHITHLVALWEREQGTRGRAQSVFKRTGGRKVAEEEGGWGEK